MSRISPAEAFAKMKDEGFTYVDVRTPEEFEAGHPEGARNVPLGDTFVIDAAENAHEYRLVRTNSLDDFSMATPAIVGDRLLIRTQHHLYSIRNTSR